MAIDAETLDAIRAAVRDEINAKPKKLHERRPAFMVRLPAEEMAQIDAFANARGISRAELTRQALAQATGAAITVHREIPERFRRARNRTKPTHHVDSATDALARDDAARRLVAISIERKALLATAEAATPWPHVDPGMLSDAAGASAPPKLPRSR